MVLARWQATIVDKAGNVQSGAAVTVRREATGAPLASLYSDRAGNASIGNPFNADPEGFAAFHVAGGAYRITATKGGFSRVWRYVPIGLAAEQDSPPIGVAWRFDDATADADPGAGLLRFNDADPALATAIHLAAEDADGIPQGAWLESFDDGGDPDDRGTLILRSVDNAALVVARVTGSLAANGSPASYYTIPVTILSASDAGSFAAGAVFGLMFGRTGTDGADGAGSGDVTGPAGGVIDNEFALFDGATGKAIKGSALLLANDAAARAATANRVLQAGLLSSAAAPQALADASTVAVTWTAGINFTLTVTANRTLGNPSGGIPGQLRTVLVQGNDGTERTLTFGNQYGGELPTLDDITGTKKYLLTIYCKAAGQFLVTAIDGSDA